MPELPEVETVVRSLRPRVVGRRIRAFSLLRPDYARPAGLNWGAALVGRRIVSLERRAKRLVFALDDGNRFFAHLGMSGRVTFGKAGREAAKHTHVLVSFPHGEVHFVDPRRFGGLRWLAKDAADEKLGPEPLDMQPAELAFRLSRTRRAVKTALLDQSLVAGLGNIYADEALFLAGIHPGTRSDLLERPAVGELCRGIKRVLRKAIRHRGSTLRDYVDAAGQAGAFRRLHQVYAREGQPCNRCRAPIARIVLGGRSTHFCPRCQPPQIQLSSRLPLRRADFGTVR